MPSIRRHIHIAAGPRRVWKSLTTADGLTSWLADEARIDARKGGRIVLVNEDDEGNPVKEYGIIHKWRPTSHFEISWDKMGTFPTRGSKLAFQLALDGGETRLSIVHTGYGEQFDDEDKRGQLDTDWRRALKSLQSMLDAE